MNNEYILAIAMMKKRQRNCLLYTKIEIINNEKNKRQKASDKNKTNIYTPR